MDFCRNVPVSGDCHQPEHHLAGSTLDDLFSAQNTEVDVSLEWLSVFVEECFSSTGNYLPAPGKNVVPTITNTTPKPSKPSLKKPQEKPSSMQKFSVPGKARSKRKKRAAATTSKAQNPFTTSIWSQQTNSDPPLLQQTYWLADSELIVPKKMEEMEKKSSENGGQQQQHQQQQQGRRCSHCQSQRTPQWRAGPLGPKTLCNACGVRYKSGRLLPEYRPAKSPTFVSYLHSNSHKKVLEMRMSVVPSD